LLFSAFLLLLLVSLSVPIIKDIFIFRLYANVSAGIFNASATGNVRFGVWGYCISAINVSVAGISQDTSSEQCSKPKLGYDFDDNVKRALNVSGVNSSAISRALAAVLVLHPIACGLTFLAFLTSLFILRWRGGGSSRVASIFTLVIGLIAALLTTVVFLIDVIMVAVVRNRIRDETDGDVTGTWGNGVWMTLGATVALWAALVGACVGFIRGPRKPRGTERY